MVDLVEHVGQHEQVRRRQRTGAGRAGQQFNRPGRLRRHGIPQTASRLQCRAAAVDGHVVQRYRAQIRPGQPQRQRERQRTGAHVDDARAGLQLQVQPRHQAALPVEVPGQEVVQVRRKQGRAAQVVAGQVFALAGQPLAQLGHLSGQFAAVPRLQRLGGLERGQQVGQTARQRRRRRRQQARAHQAPRWRWSTRWLRT